MSKKAVSPYLAVVLILMLFISLAVFGSQFIKDYSTKTIDQYTEVVNKQLDCDATDFLASDLCQDDMFVYVSLENSGSSIIKGFVFTNVYVSNELSNSYEVVSLYPREKRNFKILKSSFVKHFEIVPTKTFEEEDHYCSNLESTFENIAYCD